MNVDSLELFEALRTEMNANPDRFRLFGEAYMNCLIVMRRDGTDPFVVRLVFDELRCEDVSLAKADDPAEFSLDGQLDAWQSMFDDVLANGRATGAWTINSLALMGDRIVCDGTDPMGLDKFSRFNQTLQEYFDGASQLGASV